MISNRRSNASMWRQPPWKPHADTYCATMNGRMVDGIGARRRRSQFLLSRTATSSRAMCILSQVRTTPWRSSTSSPRRSRTWKKSRTPASVPKPTGGLRPSHRTAYRPEGRPDAPIIHGCRKRESLRYLPEEVLHHRQDNQSVRRSRPPDRRL